MSILPPRLSLEAGGSQHIALLLSAELLGPCPSHKPRLGTPSVPFQVGEVLEEHSEAPWPYFPLSPQQQGWVAAGAAAAAAGELISSSQHFPRRACGSRRATAFQHQGGEPRPGQQEGSLAVRRMPGPAIGRLQGFPVPSARAAARPRHLFLRGRRSVGSACWASGSRRP